MSGSRVKALRRQFIRVHGRSPRGARWEGSVYTSRWAMLKARYLGRLLRGLGHEVVFKDENRELKRIWWRHQHPVPGVKLKRPLFRKEPRWSRLGEQPWSLRA